MLWLLCPLVGVLAVTLGFFCSLALHLSIFVFFLFFFLSLLSFVPFFSAVSHTSQRSLSRPTAFSFRLYTLVTHPIQWLVEAAILNVWHYDFKHVEWVNLLTLSNRQQSFSFTFTRNICLYFLCILSHSLLSFKAVPLTDRLYFIWGFFASCNPDRHTLTHTHSQGRTS